MNFLSPRTLGLLLGLTILAVAVGLVTDSLGWCLWFVTLLVLVLLAREAQQFFAWSERPLSRPHNKDEIWDEALHRLYRQLQRERERTRDVLERLRSLQVVTESLPDGAIIVGEAGEIEQLNGAAKRLLNLTDRDRGSNLATLLRHPELVALLRDQFAENMVELASPVDNNLRLEVRKFGTQDNRTILLIRDVTELNRLLSMRQEFIANVSHELRSPLTVIVGYLETLADEELDRQTLTDIIARLSSPAGRMQALVDDLLLLTRLESSPLPAPESVVPVRVADVLNQVLAETETLASADHSLQLVTNSDANILGVESELYSAFSNLITNAIRYSPNGGAITISWSDGGAQSQDPIQNLGARFCVADQGTGIAPEHLSRLTERFYRVDLTSARVRGGTGLGLAIVKHVLKRHKADLSINTQLGHGSEFCCEFPETQLIRTQPSYVETL